MQKSPAASSFPYTPLLCIPCLPTRRCLAQGHVQVAAWRHPPGQLPRPAGRGFSEALLPSRIPQASLTDPLPHLCKLKLLSPCNTHCASAAPSERAYLGEEEAGWVPRAAKERSATTKTPGHLKESSLARSTCNSCFLKAWFKNATENLPSTVFKCTAQQCSL